MKAAMKKVQVTSPERDVENQDPCSHHEDQVNQTDRHIRQEFPYQQFGLIWAWR
jgi:hypothetical protein